MKRSTRLVLLALVLIVFFGGQWLWRHARTPTVAAAVPTQYRLGQLEFKPCTLRQPQSGLATAAWCAPFNVPENWARPDGRKLVLRLALIRARAAQPAPDPVLYIAGGPGQSAIDTWPEIAPALDDVLAQRNVILLDQRGTGGSAPLTCPAAPKATTPPAARAAVARTGKSRPAPQPALSGTARLRATETETRVCLAALQKRGLNPADFTTTQAVQDLAALRRALGDPQFDLVGVSYGTRVAQQFLMRYPHAVRSMVLDSVVPNALILGQDFGVNLDAALRDDFALCTHEPACHKAFGDPWTTLLQLKKRLEKNTPEVNFRTPDGFQPKQEAMTADALVGLVRLYAYSPLTAALLPLSLHAASAGHYGPLLAQSHFISSSLQHSLNEGMQLSVVCSEDVPWLKATPAEAATLLGDAYIRQLKAQCAIWPRGVVPADFHAPLRSSVPTLILEGQFDPVTPPRYGTEVLEGLSDARMLIAAGQGHNVIGAGCMPRLVKRFIEKPEPQKLDASCLAQLKPTAPFLDYNGAAP
ncbi:alpha/beta fold hydrolase [Metallibacterium sp.]|uniref:alpha/beta fold hydrolase n=1 Tax=Metallibacterium sp. TaxID=2940281 RepID=UPI00261CAF0C|nr:alpha/beta fold hydrolase [Metallibacterium sp.]